MTAIVPTQAEFNTAMIDVTDDVAVLQQQVTSLEARVAALEAGSTTPPDPIDPPPGGTEGYLNVAVYMGGTSYMFHEADATDIGNFHSTSGDFVMQCRRQVIDGCPLRIDFRRMGMNGDWSCIVFELGDILGTPDDLTNGYSVDITDDAGAHHVIEIASHWYTCRWRWQSGKWPHQRDVADMVAAKEVPAFDAAIAINAAPLAPAVYEPLGFAGLERRMPNTGSRGDIGNVTEYQGWALCTVDPFAWDSVLAQAEAMSSFPWIMRDASTGAPLDIVNTYPMASYYEDGRTNPRLYTSQGAKAAGVEPDVAHQPAGAYAAYLRTGDPYYLEMLQFQVLFIFTEVPRDNPQLPGYGQVRALAWSARTITQAWHCTPEAVPSWLLPKSVMQNLLDQTVTTLTSSLNRGDLLRTVFHAPDTFLNFAGNTPTGTCVGPWQCDFALAAWAWAAVLEPRFTDAAAFICQNALDRLGGESGWPPGVPETYSLQVCDVPDGPVYDSWQKAWQVNAPQIGYDPANPPMSLHYTSAAEYDYPNGLLAGLAMVEQARRHGIELPECRRILEFLWDAMAEGAYRIPAAIYWRSAIAH